MVDPPLSLVALGLGCFQKSSSAHLSPLFRLVL
jgi:hypothetical protein